MNFFSGAEWCWNVIPACSRMSRKSGLSGRSPLGERRRGGESRGQQTKRARHGVVTFVAPGAPRSSARRSATSRCTSW